MFMKLTTRLNFINVLCTAFTPIAPKSVRIQSSFQYIFMLLGSTGTKAAGRTLMKLTLGRHSPPVATGILKLATYATREFSDVSVS